MRQGDRQQAQARGGGPPGWAMVLGSEEDMGKASSFLGRPAARGEKCQSGRRDLASTAESGAGGSRECGVAQTFALGASARLAGAQSIRIGASASQSDSHKRHSVARAPS